MKTSDIKLIQQAQASRDYQEVDQLLSQAESDECRDMLKHRSRILYAKEQVFAGYY